ncbi:hypothetical protein BAE44_0024585 [Dichanthelium oligosanthes]|uniref:Uncharacterized protein n=1 Tax=Dichanthelium oligosanthes TaxID=888268 RepID=A0A1E5UNG2_9POAL|nr:hypothetical protein BAE44_0024585 [Dichanthelium oligosanthes]
MFTEEDIDDQFFYQSPDHPALLQGGLNIADEQRPAQLRSTTFPAGDGDHAALASAFFSGQNGKNMDTLNKAFLKGMEDANKFLPTNNSLLIDREATSGQHLPRHSNLLCAFATNQNKEELRGNGRGCKNRFNWDDLEPETCRNSKVMVPEPEETGETVDEMIVNRYELCLKEMKALRITMAARLKRTLGRKGGGDSGLEHLAHPLCTGHGHGRQPPECDRTAEADQVALLIKG